MAEFAGPRNRVEIPFLCAGTGVESQHVAFHIFLVEAAHCRPHHDGVVRNHHRRGIAKAANKIALETSGIHCVQHIDHTVVTEAFHRLAAVGIKRYQVVTGGGEHNAVVAVAIAPIRHPTMHFAWGSNKTITLVEPVHPQRFAGAGIGSEVTLWGTSASGAVLPIDEVAAAAGTVSYELLCALAPRVPVIER